MKKSTGLGKYIYMEWLIPVRDYYFSIRKNEAVFELLVPLLCSIACTIAYCFHRKLLVALDGLAVVLPSAISILIGFTAMLITLLLTGSGKSVENLKKTETSKVLYKKPITLYQCLHIHFSHSLFSEIFLLLIVFLYLFLEGIGIPLWLAFLLLIVEIYLTLHILMSMLRGIANIYFSFYNNKDK